MVELAELARTPTLANWWALLSRQLNVSQPTVNQATANQVNEEHISEPECTP